MYEADIQAAIDKWIETERKAAAWDRLHRMASNPVPADITPPRVTLAQLLGWMGHVIHPNQIQPTEKGNATRP